jgi:hypothetical protein
MMANWNPRNIEELKECAQEFSRASSSAKKALFESGLPLFVRINIHPRVLGPSINEEGKIMGDQCSVETMIFQGSASELQKSFYDELLKIKKSPALEYMLNIENTITIWKKDVEWIIIANNYLKKTEQELINEEEAIVEQMGKHCEKIHNRIPEALKRHFPKLFENEAIEEETLFETIRKIKEIEKKVEAEEGYISRFLEETRRDFPFLFEK